MKYLLVVLFVCLSSVESYSANRQPIKGVASWYGPGFHGRKTASGERFNRMAFTAAHRRFPFGSMVRVCHHSRCVTVKINDRGPYSKGRSIDLSQAAARRIRCSGICDVTIRRIR